MRYLVPMTCGTIYYHIVGPVALELVDASSRKTKWLSCRKGVVTVRVASLTLIEEFDTLLRGCTHALRECSTAVNECACRHQNLRSLYSNV